MVLYVFLGVCPFYLSSLICWQSTVHSISLISFISVRLVVMSPLSILILVIWVLESPLFSFLSLVKGLSIMLIFSKNQLGFVDFLYCFSVYYFINFCSTLYLCGSNEAPTIIVEFISTFNSFMYFWILFSCTYVFIIVITSWWVDDPLLSIYHTNDSLYIMCLLTQIYNYCITQLTFKFHEKRYKQKIHLTVFYFYL